MRLPATLLAAVPFVALSACAATDGSAAPADVPDGVAEQYATLAAEIEERGGEVESGPWTVGYIVEGAEPWFEGPEKASFREPDAEATHHIEVIPRETATGRIVPDVPVTVEILDADGKVVDSGELNFLHSTFFHYANNFEVPEEGAYTLRATLGAPTFLRHGEKGERPALAEGTTVEFEDVELTDE